MQHVRARMHSEREKAFHSSAHSGGHTRIWTATTNEKVEHAPLIVRVECCAPHIVRTAAQRVNVREQLRARAGIRITVEDEMQFVFHMAGLAQLADALITWSAVVAASLHSQT